ncbi:MAG: 3-dehydroquinate synthase, partial [Hyphomicrobiales bacterium]|nr:3-dehydroquinate synthase [Hyphomicrobiales bacterium]
MFDKPSTTKGDVRLQSFEIRYEYPVVFTHDAFDPRNCSVLDALARREP